MGLGRGEGWGWGEVRAGGCEARRTRREDLGCLTEVCGPHFATLGGEGGEALLRKCVSV